MRMAVALTIAGSDSSGGAGIQADLKTFTAFGVYGMSVLTAITAQNTVGVRAAYELPLDLVGQQFDAVMEDIPAGAAKTGMLATPAMVELVAARVRQHGIANLVVDPVMVAKSGDRLLAEEAVATVRERLLPLALVVTPNLPEAEVLVGRKLSDEEGIRRAAEELCALGARSVVIKGGHRPGPEVVDLFYDGRDFHAFAAARIDTPHTHGTGCTFSAAIAAGLALGRPLREAVREAKVYTAGAVRHNPGLGHGHGPLNHMWRLAGPATPVGGG